MGRKKDNGLTKFIYHETSMVVPIANAIYDENLKICEFIQKKKNLKSLTFNIPDKKNFPILKMLNKVNEYASTSIIINASNEVLVDHFLRKKVPFLAIPLIIEKILSDRNYKKYAIKEPKSISQIFRIDEWSRNITYSKIRK